MKKRFSILLSVLLSISLLFPLTSCDGSKTAPDVSTIASETSTESTLRFEILEDGIIRVEDGSAYFPLEDGTLSYAFVGEAVFGIEAVDIVVPAEFNGKTVTEIHSEAFYQSKKTLRSVTLPDTIRSIGKDAFKECELLSEINLPTSIRSIGESAFAYCKSLKHAAASGLEMGSLAFAYSGLETIVLSDGLESIPPNAFSETNLKEVVLPSSVRTIETYAFSNSASLEKIILNDGLQRIGTFAFCGTNLQEIVIPASVTDIVDYTFARCETLKHVYFEGNAPEDYMKIFGPADLSYTVHYHEGATGFTSPEWNGHPTEIW